MHPSCIVNLIMETAQCDSSDILPVIFYHILFYNFLEHIYNSLIKIIRFIK